MLYHQYIRSPYLPNRAFRSVVGAGMGLKHSSHLANLCLYLLAEKFFVLLPITMQTFGIIRYWRYFDDILIVLNHNDRVRIDRFFATFSSASECFIPDLEPVSNSSVSMLNMCVYIDCNSCLQTRAIFKSTSLGTPLSPSSAHAPHVHRSWPYSTLHNTLALCSTPRDMNIASAQYIQRFISHGAPDQLIFKLRSMLSQCKLRSRLSAAAAVVRTSPHPLPVIDKVDHVSWCVLPFHPLWDKSGAYRSISGWLNGHDCHQIMMHAGVKYVGARISFSNILKPAYIHFNNWAVGRGKWRNSSSSSLNVELEP